ncbi:hypothetical protein DL763_010273 [Monosporascus cannonballus]|nr:hypothetical protein DL763_010273 [Monosporascus cannonballus]
MADQQEQPPCRILCLIDAVAAGRIPNSRIVRLVVNRAKAYATTRADRASIPWECFDLIGGGFLAKGERDRARVREARGRYDAVLAQRVLAGSGDVRKKPELVVLAG